MSVHADAWGGAWSDYWAGAWGSVTNGAAVLEDDDTGGPGLPLRRRVRRIWSSVPAPYFDESDDELALHLLGML